MVVQCTWKSADGRQIEDAVTWSWTDEGNSADVEDEVKAENCLLLEAPDTGTSGYMTVPACQLLLSCQPPNQIQNISILSESRVMEVYGHHGEYMKTIRNELLEVVEDMAVFRGDIRLDRPLLVCSIKFACLRSKSEMWLYGVKVIIAKVDNILLPPEMKVPWLEVEQRLREMGIGLSDKAEAFKQLVERCQDSPSFGQQDIGSFIDLLRLSNLIKSRSVTPITPDHSGDPDSHPSITDHEGNVNFNQDPSRFHKNGLTTAVVPSSATHEMVSKCTSPVSIQRHSSSVQTEEGPPGLEERLKTYMDQKLEALDKQMWEKIQKRFQETEAKLLCKLEEIESFVKPQGIGK